MKYITLLVASLALSGAFSLSSPVRAEGSEAAKTEAQKVTSTEAQEKTVFVKGMVCAFCAQGIERRFSGEPEIENIAVDLSNHQVTLRFKPGQRMDDQRIASLLKAAGYSVDAQRTE